MNPYVNKPKKSAFECPKERAKDYETRGRVALENGEYLKSDIYYEWARIELLKTDEH